jgi:flagella basal body P-ring formation protein FlgA
VNFFFIHLIVLCVFIVPSLRAENIALELKNEAHVAGRIYKLSDIAIVRNGDVDLNTQLAEMEVGVTPRAGYHERITREQIGKVVELKLPELRSRFVWIGAAAVTVDCLCMPLGQGRLEQVAEDFLRKSLAKEFDRYEISHVGDAGNLAIPNIEFELRPKLLQSQIRKRTAVWVDVIVSGKVYSTVPVWFSVNAWQSVWVAKADLPKDALVGRDDFKLAEFDVTNLNSAPQVSWPESKRHLRVHLSANAPILERMLEPESAVNKNDQVVVKVEMSGGLIVTAGVAQTNARVGEVIKVRNVTNQEIFMAKVIDSGTVFVDAR